MLGKVVAGVMAGALIVGGYLYWVEQGKPSYAAVGDCVSSPSQGTLDQVGCGSTGAQKVLAKFTGDNSNQCDTVNATMRAYVEYPAGQDAFVLCVGSPK
ncbi:MAG TPA: hypothetical protein VGX23_36150 [Actinocrinis sp.]|nr:hypothetical protein [Actinocrinis sp.]